jgi:tellurite resistance protein
MSTRSPEPLSISPETLSACIDRRDEELLDAVVTAAALVARADGWVDSSERSDLLEFLNRNGFWSVFSRAEVLDAFERRLRELDEAGGAGQAADSLGRVAGRSPARLVVEASEQIAAADGYLHPREARILVLIRAALAPRFRPVGLAR